MEELKMAANTIGTHSGKFHCDEAMGIALLKLLPGMKDAKVVRTRDDKELAEFDVVIDVGNVCDPLKGRFDHHQRTFEEHFSSEHTVTRLSSAGLIYKYYGQEILKQHFNMQVGNQLDIIYKRMYTNFFEAIDAIDNGVQICDGEPKYKSYTDLSSRIGRLNVSWNEKEKDQDMQFAEAVKLAQSEFIQEIQANLSSWWPARDLVWTCLETRKEFHPSGRAIFLKEPCPYKEHLYQYLEETGQPEDTVLYAVFEDNKQFRVHGLSEKKNHFKTLLPLPENLRGLRDEELSKTAGIEGLVFVHHSGFIGGAHNLEAAIKLMDLSLANLETNRTSKK
eukprot:Platyproteum_vivax@DN4493_c0_g1_i1.p1